MAVPHDSSRHPSAEMKGPPLPLSHSKCQPPRRPFRQAQHKSDSQREAQGASVHAQPESGVHWLGTQSSLLSASPVKRVSGTAQAAAPPPPDPAVADESPAWFMAGSRRCTTCGASQMHQQPINKRLPRLQEGAGTLQQGGQGRCTEPRERPAGGGGRPGFSLGGGKGKNRGIREDRRRRKLSQHGPAVRGWNSILPRVTVSPLGARH